MILRLLPLILISGCSLIGGAKPIEYLEDLEAGNAPNNAYYGLTPKGYENLTSNMAEVKRYLRQVLSILDYYKNPEETP